MAFIRYKMFGGRKYYYLVRSVRSGKSVRQIHMQYVGKNPRGLSKEEAEQFLETNNNLAILNSGSLGAVLSVTGIYIFDGQIPIERLFYNN